jgi:hypothetical protein
MSDAPIHKGVPGTVQSARGYLSRHPNSNPQRGKSMRQHSPMWERVGKALHAQFDEVAQQPLPKRWVDLINRLNELERQQRQAEQGDLKAKRQ